MSVLNRWWNMKVVGTSRICFNKTAFRFAQQEIELFSVQTNRWSNPQATWFYSEARLIICFSQTCCLAIVTCTSTGQRMTRCRDHDVYFVHLVGFHHIPSTGGYRDFIAKLAGGVHAKGQTTTHGLFESNCRRGAPHGSWISNGR